MSHPDWDYGVRPPREERAPDARFIRNQPNGPEPPHGSVADTSSLQPSPEAVGWARQADEWAQPESGERAAQDREVPGLRPSEWRPASGQDEGYPAGGRPRATPVVYGTPRPRQPVQPQQMPAPGEQLPRRHQRTSPWQPTASDVDSPSWAHPSTAPDPSATIPNMPGPSGGPRVGADRPTGPWQERTQPRGWQTPGVRGPSDPPGRWAAPGAPGPRPSDPASGRAHNGDGQEIWHDRAGDEGRRERAADQDWRQPAGGQDWRERAAGQDWRAQDERRVGDGSRAQDNWRAEPDSGSWSPGPADWNADEDRQNGWRTGPEPDPGGVPWRGGGAEPWLRDPRPAADPWAQSAADSGVIPMSWEEPAADTGSWRSPAGWPAPRSPWDDGPTARVSDSWRRRQHPWQGDAGPWDAPNPPSEESQDWGHLRPAASQPGPNDAVTEIRQSIDSDRWQRAGMPPPSPEPAPGRGPQGPHNERGSATYLGGAGDWRRDLAIRSDLGEGESRRYGTQDYRPARPAPGGTYGGVASAANGAGAAGATAGGANGARATAGGANGHPVTGTPSTGLAGSLSAVDQDEADDSGGGALAAVGYTVIWYGVPVVLFVFYVLVFGSSDRAHALTTLAGAAPQFGLSLLVSVVIAVALRWLVSSWRAASIGLAAAVLGGGLATVLVSAITGHSLT